MLFRVFPSIPGSRPNDPGGPLYVPLFDQGGGRHDNPDHYGVLYLSRAQASPVAEKLRDYRGRGLADTDLFDEGSRLVLARIEDDALTALIDLDDPANLGARGLRPSVVATRQRKPTRRMALHIYEEGVAGFEWWSTIEASWINVTLFDDRVAGRLTVVGEPEPLTVDHPAVREAAEAVGVLLG